MESMKYITEKKFIKLPVKMKADEMAEEQDNHVIISKSEFDKGFFIYPAKSKEETDNMSEGMSCSVIVFGEAQILIERPQDELIQMLIEEKMI